MADLKEYDVEINGITHTLQLNASDAKQYKDAKPHKAAAPANKQAAAPANTAASTDNK